MKMLVFTLAIMGVCVSAAAQAGDTGLLTTQNFKATTVMAKPGGTVTLQNLPTGFRYRLRVGSELSTEDCRFDGLEWECVVPVGARNGPQKVALNRAVKDSDPEIIVVPATANFEIYVRPKAEQSATTTAASQFTLVPSGQNAPFKVEVLPASTLPSQGYENIRLRYALQGTTAPAGLTTQAWKQTLDYLSLQGIAISPDSPSSRLLGRAVPMTNNQIAIVARLQGRPPAKIVLPAVAFDRPTSTSSESLDFFKLTGIGRDTILAKLQKYSIPERQRILKVVDDLKFTQTTLPQQSQVFKNQQQKKDDPDTCESIKRLQRRSGGDLDDLIRLPLDELGLVLDGTFDPNTDPWGADAASTVSPSNIFKLTNTPTGNPPFPASAFLVDTWSDQKTRDPYVSGPLSGHGIIVHQIVKERASATQVVVKSLGACVDGADHCTPASLETVLTQFCQAIRQHQELKAQKSNYKSIINLSFSTEYPSNILRGAVKFALSEGIYVITSYGNSSRCRGRRQGDLCSAFPADYTGEIDIMNSGPGKLWSVSVQRGGAIYGVPDYMARDSFGMDAGFRAMKVPPTFFAPGSFLIYPQRPVSSASASQAVTPLLRTGYAGTSFSAAYVTGTVLNVLRNCGQFPTEQEVRDLMYRAGSPNC